MLAPVVLGAGLAACVVEGGADDTAQVRASISSEALFFVHLETGSLSSAEKFYGGLFGWTFFDPGLGPDYVAISPDDAGGGPGGIMQKVGSTAPRYWTQLAPVSSVKETLARAVSLGGKVVLKETKWGNIGTVGEFQGPEGEIFGVIQPNEVSDVPMVAYWELTVQDVGKSTTFYKGVFPTWGFHEVSPDYVQIDPGSGGGGPGGITTKPITGEAARWTTFHGVNDLHAALEKVQGLGGGVVYEWDNRAWVKDSQGARFGVISVK